jgi:hypothetical protein
MTICPDDAHEFLIKKQRIAVDGPEQVTEITEVFCRKCGTVCFLTQKESAEPSRIKLARSTN